MWKERNSEKQKIAYIPSHVYFFSETIRLFVAILYLKIALVLGNSRKLTEVKMIELKMWILSNANENWKVELDSKIFNST
jgi:hypothetical protein